MARTTHLNDFSPGRMIGKLEERRSLTDVADEFKINKSVVLHAWKEFQPINTAVSKIGGDLPRKTTVDEPYIILQAKNARYQKVYFSFVPVKGLMGDKALPHRTADVQQLLERKDITLMDWSQYSPLN
ncbi:uncharacterized protein TNCV_280171 [Trichonephila clavipes]|nr:uncharacterized protein TNCV_280171 [Trichonephila clavipes]